MDSSNSGGRAFRVGAMLLPLLALQPAYAQYSAHRSGDIVQLEDARHKTIVSIIPPVGDETFQMQVNGQDVLYFPFPSIEAFKANPRLAGIPLLAPWAGRLDEQGFYANGKKYNFNMTLGNVKGATPIHGFLSQNPFWEIVELKADKKAAWLTCRLDFYRHPDWMEQFPFAHTIEITQRLEDGVLEVETSIVNLGTDPMPVAIGFHSYFQLTDSRREDWVVSVGARRQWLLDANKMTSGETRPIEKFLPNPQAVPLKDYDLDDIFDNLVRDSDGRAHFSVTGKKQKLEIEFGPKYLSAVLFSPQPPSPAGASARPPQNPNFIAIEPLAGVPDALNLAQKGIYKELQYIPPGGVWKESFWVKPSGF